jgi:uncharacterized protein involved in response to NO
MTAAEMRAYGGPALFSFGFRPFFLFGAIWAALAAPLWAIVYLTGQGLVLGVPGRDWHVHEMLFGYLAAIMAGFLLTAVPNWTGRLPVIGRPLMALFGLWAAGRAAMLAQARLGWGASAIDALFLVAFAGVIWREVLSGRNWRNLPVCALVSLFALANIGLHLRGAAPLLADFCERLALATPAVLIALIGGRIVPSFTRNWLAQRKSKALPAPFGRLDQAALALTGIGALAWVLAPQAWPAGAILVAAGAANLVRLARWQGQSTGGEALVWILHAGYAWLGIALVLLGLSVLAPAAIPRSSGVHALTAGAFGVMTLAVMTRATLGHTGRARTADRATRLIYLAVNLAALARVLAPLWLPAQPALLAGSAALWAAAFLGFAAAYGPLLAKARPRAEAQAA